MVKNPFSSEYDPKPTRTGWFTKTKLAIIGVIVLIIIALAVGLGVGLSRHNSNSGEEGESPPVTNGTTPTTGNGTWWQPKAGITWQIDLSQNLSSSSKLANVAVYDIDLFNNDVEAMQHVQSSGKKLICYFSAGSYENFRADASEFPQSVLGNTLKGWDNEKWVDTNSPIVRNIMIQRLQLAKNKSCDAVDPDNIDAYDNDNGLGLTQADAVSYVTFLANEAHKLGMGVSLKNGGAIVNQTINLVDFQVNEQCVQYNDCSMFNPFIAANKPVFHIEYPEDAQNLTPQEVCQQSPTGYSTLIKHMNLDDWYETCNGTTLVTPSS